VITCLNVGTQFLNSFVYSIQFSWGGDSVCKQLLSLLRIEITCQVGIHYFLGYYTSLFSRLVYQLRVRPFLFCYI
jgi:hypothetical protein